MKIFGPYVHTTGNLKGRKYVAVEVDGKRTTKLYSRYLMEKKLGREVEHGRK